MANDNWEWNNFNWGEYQRAYWYQKEKITNDILYKQMMLNFLELQEIKKALGLDYNKQALGEKEEE